MCGLLVVRMRLNGGLAGHLAIAKETCRVIDMGTLILTTETFQLMKPTRLVIAW